MRRSSKTTVLLAHDIYCLQRIGCEAAQDDAYLSINDLVTYAATPIVLRFRHLTFLMLSFVVGYLEARRKKYA